MIIQAIYGTPVARCPYDIRLTRYDATNLIICKCVAHSRNPKLANQSPDKATAPVTRAAE